MKVCGKKDIHVPECDDCQELEERVEAVEECCEDTQAKIEDKADTTYVDENVSTIEGQITEMSDALNERIDNIITASDPSITTLWEGALSFKGDSVQLSDDVNNYDFLDVYYKTSTASDSGYYGYIRVPSDEYENYTTTIGGINRRATGAGIRQYLTMLSFVDDTATIQDIRRWYWDGSAASDAEDSSYQTGIGIYRIDGVKISGVDAEIADARVGVDGTVYPSLGDAIRGQIQDTRDMIPQLIKTVNGNPIVLDDAFGEVKKLDVELLPIQAGTGTPSPQNIRPITGHDSVTVLDSGKNLFDKDNITFEASVILADGTISDNPTFVNSYKHTAEYIRVKPSSNLVFSGTLISSSTYNSIAFYDKDKNFISRYAPSVGVPAQFTTPNNCEYIRANVSATTLDANTIQLEYGTTATSYEAYKSQSKTVTLPHTVYGAGVGVTSGNGKEKFAYALLNDSSKWTTASGTISFMYNVSFSDRKLFATSTEGVICSAFPIETTGENIARWASAGGVKFGINSTTLTLDDIKAMASNNQIAICYELATPTDLQTTPTDITLYNGDNVISSDGDMELTYVQDMAMVIRKIEAQL